MTGSIQSNVSHHVLLLVLLIWLVKGGKKRFSNAFQSACGVKVHDTPLKMKHEICDTWAFFWPLSQVMQAPTHSHTQPLPLLKDRRRNPSGSCLGQDLLEWMGTVQQPGSALLLISMGFSQCNLPGDSEPNPPHVYWEVSSIIVDGAVCALKYIYHTECAGIIRWDNPSCDSPNALIFFSHEVAK